MGEMSSLTEDRSGDANKNEENVAADNTKSPAATTPMHGHHRFTFFDTSIIPQMSNHEIREHNKVEMSLLSSLTMATSSQLQEASQEAERSNATEQTRPAMPEDVESKKASSLPLRPRHVVKIITGDGNDVIELTPHEVQRIRKSKTVRMHILLKLIRRSLTINQSFTLAFSIVHERIESGVNFSFNYNVLLLVASVLAGLGLVSDSIATIIVSSIFTIRESIVMSRHKLTCIHSFSLPIGKHASLAIDGTFLTS